MLISASTLICLPYTATGPAMVIALAKVTSTSSVPSALEALPIVKPVRPGPKLQPAVLNAPLKSAPNGSIRKTPGPAKPEVPVVGASLVSTNVPPLIVVAPVYVLLAVSVRVLPPSLVRLPVPPMVLATVMASDRLNTKAPLLVTVPVPKLPSVPPAPICNVPALIVVVPL